MENKILVALGVVNHAAHAQFVVCWLVAWVTLSTLVEKKKIFQRRI